MNPLDQPDRERGAIEQALVQANNKTIEAEALLMTVNTVIGELSEPLTVIIGLSEFLLAQIDRNDPIAIDLNTIVNQINRMSEIIKAVNYLSR